MNSQFNSTGEFGINRYGPASGPQHIASAPQQGGDGEMEQRDMKEQNGIEGGQRQKRRSHRNRSHRNRSHRNKSRRNKSQCGGKRSAKRSEKRRNSDKRRSAKRSDKRQRGGK